MAGLTCVHRLVNAPQVFSLTQPQSLTGAGKNQPPTTPLLLALPPTLTVDRRRFRTHTPRAKVSGRKWNKRPMSPSHSTTSWCSDRLMSVPCREEPRGSIHWSTQSISSLELAAIWGGRGSRGKSGCLATGRLLTQSPGSS